MADASDRTGWVGLRRLPIESPLRALLITWLVCAFCSALIATTVGLLQPYRERNRAEQRDERIRALVGLVPGLGEVVGPLATAELELRLVDLASGDYATGVDPGDFDAREAERDPERSLVLPPGRDLAGIGRRAKLAPVFLVSDAQGLRLLVLPVHGAGYVSTLYGYLALDPDLNTIRGLSFYEHGETPGLGAEIDNPRWLEQWSGKWLRDASGRLRVEVARERAALAGEAARHQVDGISGATRTGAGVTQLLHFWLGPDGFGPYLDRLDRERDPR